MFDQLLSVAKSISYMSRMKSLPKTDGGNQTQIIACDPFGLRDCVVDRQLWVDRGLTKRTLRVVGLLGMVAACNCMAIFHTNLSQEFSDNDIEQFVNAFVRRLIQMRRIDAQ